jgi:hypothetical protein
MTNSYASGLSIDPDEWNHVSVRVNKSGITFDVNNGRTSIIDGISFAGSSNNVSIASGGSSWSSNASLIGAVDDVTLYSEHISDKTVDQYLASFPIFELNPNTRSDESEYRAGVTIGSGVTTTNDNPKFVFSGGTSSTIEVSHPEFFNLPLKSGWTFSTYIDPGDVGTVKGTLLSKPVQSGPKIDIGVTTGGKIYCNL